MATVLSTLYPPLIDTFMPAFPYTGPAPINFSVSPYNSWKEIKYMHVTLVNQKTNQNAFMSVGDENIPTNTSLINGVWIIPFSSDVPEDIFIMDTETNSYTLNIPASLLKNQDNKVAQDKQKTFVCDYYYKVQIRFDCCVDEQPTNAAYLTKNRAFFSEWSSVCLLKAIPNIKLHLNNFTFESTADYAARGMSILDTITDGIEPVRTPQYVPGIIPFSGNLTFEGTSNSDTIKSLITTSGNEYLQSYNIQVVDYAGEVIEDSGKIYVTNKDKANSFYWLCDMTGAAINDANNAYTVILTFVTNNQYTFSRSFQFSLIEASPIDFNPVWSFNKRTLPSNGIEKAVLVTSEDGLVSITINVPQLTSPGYLFIKRASSRDDYKKWDLIDCTYIPDGDNILRTFVDRTVSSLVRYKYSCQYLTQKGSWTKTVFTDEIVYPDFYDILISRGEKQLAIRYNEQISTLTPVVNRIKIDTLGGKYPKFAENAKLGYKQFTLTGLIIAESDYNRCFLNDLEYYDQMKDYDDNIGGAYAIRNDTVKEEFTDSRPNGTYSADITQADTYIRKRKRDTQKNTYHDLYPMDNWWWEREFREEAIKWLNDGEPKLYRSMTEGNMIVMFSDISLTPNAQLGRRVWNFSATVCEVGDGYSLEQLDALGIFPIEDDYVASFNEGGQEAATTYRKYVGQQYRVKGNLDSNGTKVVSDGLIQEQLSWLYSGLYENYKLVPNTIKLRDVKIQFESLPQWYDLDTLNPDSPGAPLVTITVQGEDGEEQTKIVKLEKENGVWVYKDISTDSVFDEQDIAAWLSDWEDSMNKEGHGGNLLFKLNLDSGEDSTHTIDPTIGTSDKIVDAILYYINSETQKLAKKNYGLGYKLNLSFASPYDSSEDAAWLNRTIFVNSLGYYQIPSELIVKQITLFDEAVATIDYILEYGLNYSDDSEPDSYEVVSTVVGQVSGKWNADTDITPFIKAKYAAYNKEEYVTTRQMIDSWKATSFDLTPYAIVDFKATDETYTTQRIVGRTGVLNLKTDYPMDLCVIRGKRMVEVPASRQPYLDDWEYVLDESVNEADSGEEVSSDEHWWLLRPENTSGEADILIRVLLGQPFDDTVVRTIMENWRTLDFSAFVEKYEVKKPQNNTVYGVINSMGFFEHKLYYQDQGWYDVTFPNIEQDDMSIAYAKVPVYGMIGYRANIMKKLWLQ